MNTSIFRRFTAPVLCVVALTFSLAATYRTVAVERLLAAPTSVAVVDWLKVTDNSAQWKDMQAELQKMAEDVKSENAKKKSELDDQEQALKVLLQGTPAWRQAQDKYNLTNLTYQAWMKFSDDKLNTAKAARQVALYNQIVETVEKVAKRDGWDIVLWNDGTSKTIGPAQMNQAVELMSRRQVMFADVAKVDITDAVTQMLNNDYKNSSPGK